MREKPTHNELEQKTAELEGECHAGTQEKQVLQEGLKHLESTSAQVPPGTEKIRVSDINIEWDSRHGTCTFENLPVAMMWVDTTLAGLMSGLQAMVGAKRFNLALQGEGRRSVEADWDVIAQFSDFRDGFRAIANIAAVAGWGEWKLISLDKEKKEALFRVTNSWEGRYQKALGECWGSGMVAGKLAGYCSKLFETNCWADQTAFIAEEAPYDEFTVRPSKRSLEKEIENLLETDEATRADMAVALQTLRREVEDRKHVENTLRESEATLQSIFRAAPKGIGMTRDRILLQVNDRICEMTGYSREELVGQSARILYRTDDDFEFVGRAKYEEIERRGTGSVETRWQRKDGRLIDVWLSSTAIDPDNLSSGVTFTALDITERKQAEENKQKIEQQLRQAQKMESLGTLAGGIAHDFNNILGIIIGNTELAMDGSPEGNPARSNLQEVLKASIRARDMVKRILAFSRQADQERKAVRMRPVVEESIALLRSSIPSTIRIQESFTSHADTVLADPTQIHQILMNLCTNAAHAMRKTGGVLEISLGNLELDEDAVSLHHDLIPGTYLLLTVKDTGCGMKPEVVERIFDPYFTTKAVDEGTGMGLSVVHGILRDCGGTVRVESEPGKGTTFALFFPLHEAEAEIGYEADAPLPAGSQRILFVDDREGLADLGKQMLEHLGYDVTASTGSMEALDTFRAEPGRFDLVVTDMTMPNMTGADLSKELLRIRPDLKIILCTGYSEMITEEEAKKIGINAFLLKPLTMREMAETVRRVLEEEGP